MMLGLGLDRLWQQQGKRLEREKVGSGVHGGKGRGQCTKELLS